MIWIDKICYTSGLRYTNALVKLSYTLLTILCCIISKSVIIACVALIANGYLNIRKGGVSIPRYQKFMAVPLVFLLLSTIAIIVNISPVPMDAFAFQAGEFYITGSFHSLFHGIQLILTALASVSCLYFLSLNTTMTDILNVLMKLHVPKLIIELMLLIYRFIFILGDLASAITTSQHSRLSNKSFRTSVKSFGLLGSSLFVLSVKQSGELYDALESRCYQGNIHVLTEDYPVRRKDIISIAIFELILIAIIILENLYL